MPKLSSIKGMVRDVDVTIGDVTLKVTYHPAKFTGKLRRDLTARADAITAKIEKGETVSEEDTEVSARLLVDLMAAWDLEDDEGKLCPITVEFLADELGYYGIQRINTALMADINPNV